MRRLSLPHGWSATPRCAGLEIAPTALRLALLQRRASGYRVLRLDSRPLPAARSGQHHFDDLQALATHCRALLADLTASQVRLVLGLPVACLVRRQLVLPAAATPLQRITQVRSEMAAHGHDEASEEFDYPLPDRGQDGVDIRVEVSALPALHVEHRLALADALALRLAALPPEDHCLRSFLRNGRLHGGAPEQSALLRLDEAGSWLMLPAQSALPLRWQADMPAPTLLHELAPLLGADLRQLMLTGSHPELARLAGLLARYSGRAVTLGRLPPTLDLRRPPDAPIPAALHCFHLALALAARGLA